jgi:hypothetical protein
MSKERKETTCGRCGQLFWVEATSKTVPLCSPCDMAGWDNIAAFTGPAEMILMGAGGGTTLLEVLDSFGGERVRVVVYREKRTNPTVN